MSELFGQLGINLPMLAAQAVNFAILLAVLTIFVFRPLLKVMAERRHKIELGVRGGEVAAEKIAEAESLALARARQAESEAVKIVGKAEDLAREKGTEIVGKARLAGEEVLAQAQALALRQKKEEMDKMGKEAADLIRQAIAQAVQEKPEAVDEALVKRAAILLQEKI